MNPSPALLLVRTRASLDRFVLPFPDAVVPGAVDLSDLAPATVQTLARLAVAVSRTPAETAAALPLIREALALLPEGEASQDPARQDAHDTYFHLARTDAPAGSSYLRGLIAALEVFLVEACDDHERSDYAAMADALIELWLAALGLEAPVREARPVTPMLERAPDPVRRWLRGHHVFAAITQGLIWTLRGFESPIASTDAETAEALIQRTTRLYRASSAAFRFTADFDRATYTDVIRPSMSEPHVPPGFSGSMSLDHGVLVGHLSRMRAAMTAARAMCPQAHAEMTDVLSQVYDNHRWVCERFAGNDGPSLRTDRLCGDNAAVHMIDRFKSRRVAMLG